MSIVLVYQLTTVYLRILGPQSGVWGSMNGVLLRLCSEGRFGLESPLELAN